MSIYMVFSSNIYYACRFLVITSENSFCRVSAVWQMPYFCGVDNMVTAICPACGYKNDICGVRKGRAVVKTCKKCHKDYVYSPRTRSAHLYRLRETASGMKFG